MSHNDAAVTHFCGWQRADAVEQQKCSKCFWVLQLKVWILTSEQPGLTKLTSKNNAKMPTVFYLRPEKLFCFHNRSENRLPSSYLLLLFWKLDCSVYLQTLPPWSRSLIPKYRSPLLNPLPGRDYIAACWINKQRTYRRSHTLDRNLLALLLCFLPLISNACLWPHFHPQTPMLAWQLWIAAWMQPRPAMWTTCARSSARNTSRLVSNPPPSRACATGPNAIRLWGGSSTGFPPTTRTSCSSALVPTRRARSVDGRPSCPVAPMKAQKSPAALHRWGSATPITCAG